MLTFRDILRTCARICSVRRKLLFESALDRPRAESVAAVPVTFRYGTAHDLELLGAPSYSYGGDARHFGYERLRLGDRLVLCESGGRVVFYAWVMFGQMDMSCRNYVALAPDCAYTYKLFTVPDCRGQRICPAYYQWIRQELRELGYGSLLAWVEAGNHASIRAHTRAGFRKVGCIWHLRILFRSYFLKPGRLAAAPLHQQNACAS
jgi:hypothetical protein